MATGVPVEKARVPSYQDAGLPPRAKYLSRAARFLGTWILAYVLYRIAVKLALIIVGGGRGIFIQIESSKLSTAGVTLLLPVYRGESLGVNSIEVVIQSAEPPDPFSSPYPTCRSVHLSQNS